MCQIFEFLIIQSRNAKYILDKNRRAPVHRDPPSREEETPRVWGGARIFWEIFLEL